MKQKAWSYPNLKYDMMHHKFKRNKIQAIGWRNIKSVINLFVSQLHIHPSCLNYKNESGPFTYFFLCQVVWYKLCREQWVALKRKMLSFQHDFLQCHVSPSHSFHRIFPPALNSHSGSVSKRFRRLTSAQVTASHTICASLEVRTREVLWGWSPRASLAQSVYRSVLSSCRRGPLQLPVPGVPAAVPQIPPHAQMSVCLPIHHNSHAL